MGVFLGVVLGLGLLELSIELASDRDDSDCLVAAKLVPFGPVFVRRLVIAGGMGSSSVETEGRLLASIEDLLVD